MGDEGAMAIAAVLNKCTALTALDLAGELTATML